MRKGEEALSSSEIGKEATKTEVIKPIHYPEKKFDTFRILLLAMGHLVNDSYSNIVPPLLPMMKEAYNLSYAASGAIMTVYTITSSVIQPVFGYYADKHGKRWLVAISVAWIAFFMSLIGAVSYLGLDSNGSYIAILFLIGMAGFGSSAYHPQASTMVPKISGDNKGFGVSIFSAGGNLGYAIMPLLVVPVTAIWGLKGTLVFMVPGFVMTLLLYKYAPEVPIASSRVKLRDIIGDILSVAKPLTSVVAVVCMRAWLFFGLITFLPLYLAFNHQSASTASLHLFILLLFGAIGGLMGGWLSDKYGRKTIIVWSMLICAPLLYMALSTQGYIAWVLTAVAGMTMLASFSPAILIAQDLIPKNQGMASGIILGLAMGIGGLGIALTGAIADSAGITAGTFSLVLLPFLGFLFALTLPGALLPHKRNELK